MQIYYQNYQHQWNMNCLLTWYTVFKLMLYPVQWYLKRLDAITDALICQSKFRGIYCNSLIPAKCTTINTLWFTNEVEVILKQKKPKSLLKSAWIAYARLPKLKPEKLIQKWLDWNALSPKRIIEKILCLRFGYWWFNRSWFHTLSNNMEKFHFTIQNY